MLISSVDSEGELCKLHVEVRLRALAQVSSFGPVSWS